MENDLIHMRQIYKEYIYSFVLFFHSLCVRGVREVDCVAQDGCAIFFFLSILYIYVMWHLCAVAAEKKNKLRFDLLVS